MSGIAFRSLISSSAGNSTVVANTQGALMIDAGFSSQRKFREALTEVRENFGHVNGVVITHAHRDHVNTNVLKVLRNMETPLFLSIETLGCLASNPERAELLSKCNVEVFEDPPFEVGGFRITSFSVPHSPSAPNRGFVITCDGIRLGFATDLNSTRGLAPRLADCDFIYFESNHDLQMLQMNPNPNSYYHLPNPKSADFLTSLTASGAGPRMVMLGHLSVERNSVELAAREFRKRMNGRPNAPMLQIAPPYSPSSTAIINRTGTPKLMAGSPKALF
ncbi:MAG: MBL fold metallo-hydrolase [Planctomycetota bacterium]